MPATAIQRLPLPVFADVLEAAARIVPYARVTPVVRVPAIDVLAGCEVHFKCEQFQHMGAFKFRGACNAVFSLGDVEAGRGVVTHSSGNHGAALAHAAKRRGIPCHVVVPEGAVAAKLANIQAQGAVLHRCEPTIAAREAMCTEVQAKTGAEVVHPYTDPRVIAGQGTAALELLTTVPGLDAIVAPVGGGGLSSGTAITTRAVSPSTSVIGAEPSGAAETFASLQAGHRVTDFAPDTICDGLRGTLGAINFELLRDYGVDVVTVNDAGTLAALQLLLREARLVVEPSSAIALAAVLARRESLAGKRVGVILSGGNVDPALLAG